MGKYYPDHPTPQQVERIRERLARQWACIQNGDVWEDNQLPEPILAILEGPLAWRKLPMLPAFDPGDHAACLAVWERPDGIYFTLSSEGAQRLGVRPVGLTARRRAAAASQGVTDALGDVLSGECVLVDGRWLPMVRLGEPVPLFRWTRDVEVLVLRATGQVIGGEMMASLDAIGPDNLPAEWCEAERSRTFTRPASRADQGDRAGRALREAAI